MRPSLALLALILAAGCGEDAARALHDDAVAALASGDLVAAEIAAEKAAARDEDLGGPAAFVLGCASFVRCQREEIRIFGPTGGAAAIDAALAHAERARDHWQAPATSRPDWPAARRNVERALLKVAELRARKAEAESRPVNPPQPPKPLPGPKPSDAPRQDVAGRQQGRPQPHLTELPASEVPAILDKLAGKEREKNRSRRAEQKGRRAEAERDW